MAKLVPLPPYDDNVRFITGPFLVKLPEGNRNKVRIFYKNRKNVFMNYSRFRIEIYLGIKLARNQHVHHKDGNKLNDDLKNLEIIESSEHMRLHKSIYVDKEIICIVCKKKFILNAHQQANSKCGYIKGNICSKTYSMTYQWNWKKYAVQDS